MESLSTIFETAELMGLVMEHLQAELASSTLVACALVNKLFCNEALRVLWRLLTDLDPIVRLLPPRSVVYRDGRWLTIRQLMPSDWERVFTYSGFVRELKLQPGRPARLNSVPELEIIQSYMTNFPSLFLFPNLVKLCWGASSAVLPIILPFLSPKLRKVQLLVATPVIPSNPARKNASSALARLEYLKELQVNEAALGGRVSPQELSSSLSDSITFLSLMTFPLSISHLFVLRGLANLERLNVHVGASINELDASLPDTILDPFARLLSLEIQGHLSNITHIIKNLRMYPRRYISITGPEKCIISTSEISELCHVIGNFEKPTLQHFFLNMNPPVDSRLVDSSNMVLNAEVLLPLLTHTDLKTLAVSLNIPINLKDSDIWRIARSLPHLEALQLSHSPDYTPEGYESQLTPACLVAFTQHTSCLRELAIHIGPQWKPFVEGRNSFHSNSRLTDLEFGISKLPGDVDEREIAMVLEELFPEISELTCKDMYLLDAHHLNPVQEALRDRIALAQAWYRIKKICCGYDLESDVGMDDET